MTRVVAPFLAYIVDWNRQIDRKPQLTRDIFWKIRENDVNLRSLSEHPATMAIPCDGKLRSNKQLNF